MIPTVKHDARASRARAAVVAAGLTVAPLVLLAAVYVITHVGDLSPGRPATLTAEHPPALGTFTNGEAPERVQALLAQSNQTNGAAATVILITNRASIPRERWETFRSLSQSQGAEFVCALVDGVEPKDHPTGCITLPMPDQITETLFVADSMNRMIWASSEFDDAPVLASLQLILGTLSAVRLPRQNDVAAQLQFAPTLDELEGTVKGLRGAPRSVRTAWGVSDAILKRRPVLFVFWATWCEPCIAEFPDLRKLKETHPAVQFVGLLDEPWSRARAQRVEVWAKESTLQLQYFLQDASLQKQLFDKEKGLSLPTFAVFDRNGHLQLTMSGSIKDQSQYERLDQVLSVVSSNYHVGAGMKQ